MKRYGNIYEKIYNMDNLIFAHKNARKDKTFYREVKMVDNNEKYIQPLQTSSDKYHNEEIKRENKSIRS